MRLYYHKTDGGAEYLCSNNVEGTDEGSFESDYIVRIDGDIRKDAELMIKGMDEDEADYVVRDEALVCTAKNCKELQGEDGEFCEAHYK